MTYRLNFSENFQVHLTRFACINNNLHVIDFKNNLEKWMKANDILVENEYNYLREKGYEEKIKQKIFKSARYYLSKTMNKEKKKKEKRKNYTTKDRKLLNFINRHIESMEILIKPSEAYNNFCEIYEKYTNPYIKYLIEQENYTKKDAEKKLKKIYKNKYYVAKSKQNTNIA